MTWMFASFNTLTTSGAVRSASSGFVNQRLDLRVGDLSKGHLHRRADGIQRSRKTLSARGFLWPCRFIRHDDDHHFRANRHFGRQGIPFRSEPFRLMNKAQHGGEFVVFLRFGLIAERLIRL